MKNVVFNISISALTKMGTLGSSRAMQIVETMPRGWSLVELAEMQVPVVIVFGKFNDWAAYTGLPEQSKRRMECLNDFDLSNPDDIALHGLKMPAKLAVQMFSSFIPDGMYYRP